MVMYSVLILMAFADAFVFWNTLTRIFQSDTVSVFVLVAALALGAVVVAHEAGRLTRWRREAHGGSLVWIGFLGLLWLSVGVIIAWIRAFSTTTTTGNSTGRLASAAAAQQQSVLESVDGRLAMLFLALYLLTGALAATHAYRRGDPRSAAIRAAYRSRERAARAAADRRYTETLAERRFDLRRQDRDREVDAHGREHEVREAWSEQLQTQARQHQAEYTADPAATSGLTEGQIPPDPPNS